MCKVSAARNSTTSLQSLFKEAEGALLVLQDQTSQLRLVEMRRDLWPTPRTN